MSRKKRVVRAKSQNRPPPQQKTATTKNDEEIQLLQAEWGHRQGWDVLRKDLCSWRLHGEGGGWIRWL